MYRKARSPEIEVRERMRDLNVREDAGRYLRARQILHELRGRHMYGEITFQQYRTLRGQAISGDVSGAVKGLARVLRENEAERMGGLR